VEETLEQPLYETQTVYTWEEYYSSSMAFSKKNIIAITIIFPILGAVLILMSLVSFSRTGEFSLLHLNWGIVTIIFVIIFRFLFARQLKKNWNSSQMVHNSQNEFKFFANRMEVISPTGKSNFEYQQLYKMMETKRQFLLQPSNNQFYLVVKDNCTLELQKFLRELAMEVNKKKK